MVVDLIMMVELSMFVEAVQKGIKQYFLQLFPLVL